MLRDPSHLPPTFPPSPIQASYIETTTKSLPSRRTARAISLFSLAPFNPFPRDSRRARMEGRPASRSAVAPPPCDTINTRLSLLFLSLSLSFLLSFSFYHSLSRSLSLSLSLSLSFLSRSRFIHDTQPSCSVVVSSSSSSQQQPATGRSALDWLFVSKRSFCCYAGSPLVPLLSSPPARTNTHTHIHTHTHTHTHTLSLSLSLSLVYSCSPLSPHSSCCRTPGLPARTLLHSPVGWLPARSAAPPSRLAPREISLFPIAFSF